MKRHSSLMRIVPALAALLLAAPQAGAIPLSQAKIIIEVNASAGDGGIQIFVDGDGWRRLEVTDPNQTKIFDVQGSGSVGMTGMTELFFESAEPSFDDLPLDQLLARFVAGNYSFSATTVDGKQLSAKAALKHNIPDGPVVTSPPEGETLNSNDPVVIDWNPVTQRFPGTSLPVTVVGYEVIVERVKPQPLLVFDIHLPATVTRVTVPPEFLEAGASYIFEVLTIEASGNQTITESSFTTAGGGGAAKKPSSQQTSHLKQNHPNPFNPATTLNFELPSGGTATLRVLDVQGRLVRTLVHGQLPAGPHSVFWDGKDNQGRQVASGVYLTQLVGPGVSDSRRIVMAR